MIDTRKPSREAYVRAQRAARAQEYRLGVDAAARLAAALKQYGERLAADLLTLPKGSERLAAQRAVQIIDAQRARLATSLENAIGAGRAVAFNDILAIHNDASRAIAKSLDVPDALLGAINRPSVTLAGAWESLGTGAATWRTLLRGYVNDAVADAQKVVTAALLEGLSPQELSRRLRPYVEGAQSFHDTFKGLGAISDKMLRDPRFTREARKLRYNADRIAFSEIHNARREAELQAFAADPFVIGVIWTLSPNRGKMDGPDACDVLAESDFYGMGPGRYPLTGCPIAPHPFDRCEIMPITRSMEDLTKPKPVGQLDISKATLHERNGISAVQAERAKEIAIKALGAAQRTRAPAAVKALITQAPAAGAAPTTEKLSAGPSLQPAANFDELRERVRMDDLTDKNIKNKHDVIARLRYNGATDNQIYEYFSRYGTQRISEADVKWNKKYYGTEKQPAHPALDAWAKQQLGIMVPIPVPTPVVPVPPQPKTEDRFVRPSRGELSPEQLATELARVETLYAPRLERLKVEAQRLTRAVSDKMWAGADVEKTQRFAAAAELGVNLNSSATTWEQHEDVRKLLTKRVADSSHPWAMERAAHKAAYATLSAQMERVNEVQRRMIALRRERFLRLFETPGSAVVDIQVTLKGGLPAEERARVERARNWLSRVLPGSMQVKVEMRRTRGRAFQLGRTINMAKTDPADTWVHEISHWVENNNPEWKRLLLAFRERRTVGETATQLRKLMPGHRFEKDEIAKPDHFYSPYVGKIYPGDRYTEMLSMGLERLYNNAALFAREDPEYFNLILQLVRSTTVTSRAFTFNAAASPR